MSKYLTLFVRIWKLFKPFHKVFYLQLFLISVLGAMDIYQNILLGKIVDVASTKNWGNLIVIFLLFVVYEIVYWTFDFIKDYKYSVNFSRKSIQHLREYSLHNVLKLNISQFQEKNSMIKADTVQRGEAAMVYIMENILLNILPAIVLLIFAFITLSKFGIILFLILFSGALITFYIENRHKNSTLPEVRKMSDRQMVQYKISSEIFSHLTLIKQLAIENKYIKSYMKYRESNMLLDIDLDRKQEKHQGRRNYVMALFSLLSIGYALKLYVDGNIQLGTIFAVFAISNQVLNKAKSLQINLGRFMYNYIDAVKYLDLIDLQPEFNEHGKLKLPKRKQVRGSEEGANDTINTEIVFKNLSFKYPKGDSNVLDNVNLTIPHGQRVAFVGHSGSGKTTIVKLLMRAYDYVSYDGGPSITIGGLELRDIDSHSLRSQIGYVEQHVDLFDATVRDNILMSVDEDTLSKWEKLSKKAKKGEMTFIDQKLEEVSRLARIDEFYHRLGEARWDTEIGERGIKLSGGERQRVGIARAIIKDPSILILDEATSALDTVNEKYIKEAIDNVSRGRTTIIIAHRLSTVEDADMIVVMDKGRVVATGTHNELLAASSHYQDLIQAQLK